MIFAALCWENEKCRNPSLQSPSTFEKWTKINVQKRKAKTLLELKKAGFYWIWVMVLKYTNDI